MTPASDPISRPLSARESQIVAWLEEERPELVTAAALADAFGFSPQTSNDITRRLAAKGWLNRVAQGKYEPLLADSGGIALPNAWAALAGWSRSYYVGYASAAYHWNLTPDRPGTVQACVPVGTGRPKRFVELAITLIPQRAFSLTGVSHEAEGGQRVCLASVEKTVIDSAIRPARVSGVLALGRMLDRALDRADWDQVVELAADHPRGSAGLRRIGALLELLGEEVPTPVKQAAGRIPFRSSITLDDRKIYGRTGHVLQPWNVLVNVAPEALREELRR